MLQIQGMTMVFNSDLKEIYFIFFTICTFHAILLALEKIFKKYKQMGFYYMGILYYTKAMVIWHR